MKAITASVLLPLILSASASAELAKPVRILEHDIPHAAPFFTDIDGDGRKDLLVGHFRADPFTDARVKVFRNTGTNQVPKFDEGAWLQAGNAAAGVDEFCVTGFGPQVIDFNGDGIRDLVSGSRASLLHVFAGRDDGTFDTATAVQYVPDEGTRRLFAYNSRIFAHDWDSDGDLDLLVTRSPAVSLIRNEGDSESPRFAAPEELVNRATKGVSFSAATVADWDGDGRDDLIIGRSDGSVIWHRDNAQTDTEPSLGKASVLVGKGLPTNVNMDFEGNYEAPAGPTGQVRLCVADYNDDGMADLLLGDIWRAYIRYDSEHPRPEQTAEQRAAYELQQDLRRELWSLQSAPEDESEVARVAREERIAAIKLEGAKAWQAYRPDYHSSFGRHGSVWLFERIAP